MLKRLLALGRSTAPPLAALPNGLRVYAIGDVHGRLDLLDDLLARITADERERSTCDTALIMLGDLVDRGPASAGVVSRLMALADERAGVRFLAGNHEEMFLAAVAGGPESVRAFCRVGGRETLISYGVASHDYEAMEYGEVAEALARLVPAAHVNFIKGFENLIVLGDYAFAHAGIRPNIPLDAQRTSDLRWIRQPFLDHAGMLEKVVVHGHTVHHEIEVRPHRIGLDTGAYASGVLSAVGLEGTDRWFLQTDLVDEAGKTFVSQPAKKSQ